MNYLLAQMVNNDEAVQATAKTTRLFMGVQVQCTQCHNHPFNEWKQDQFWQINSFLRQTRRINHRKFDSASGRQVDDYAELVPGNFSGPVFFERAARCRWPIRSSTTPKSTRVRKRIAAVSWPA